MRKRKILRKLRAHLAHHAALDENKLILHQKQQIEVLQGAVTAGNDCQLELAAQAKAIDALRDKCTQQATLIAALTDQLGEVSRKLESITNRVPVSAPDDDKTPARPDNLQVIEGIGPKIADVLKKEGITTFRQLATTDAARLKNILAAAHIRVPADPTSWPKQAELAADGKMAELRALQAILDGGRLPT